jgi:hypothetical protein
VVTNRWATDTDSHPSEEICMSQALHDNANRVELSQSSTASGRKLSERKTAMREVNLGILKNDNFDLSFGLPRSLLRLSAGLPSTTPQLFPRVFHRKEFSAPSGGCGVYADAVVVGAQPCEADAIVGVRGGIGTQPFVPASDQNDRHVFER